MSHPFGHPAFNRDASIFERTALVPTVALLDFDDYYELRADLPDCDVEGIDFDFQAGFLTITGAASPDSLDGFGARPSRSFHYGVGLPDDADGADITPSFADGRLNIRIGRLCGPANAHNEYEECHERVATVR